MSEKGGAFCKLSLKNMCRNAYTIRQNRSFYSSINETIYPNDR